MTETPGDEAFPYGDYRHRLEAILAANRHYPADARRRRQTGIAGVAFLIESDGSVGTISLVSSSGHRSLDREALDLVRRSAPFPPPPDIGAIHISVPVVFELTGRAERTESP